MGAETEIERLLVRLVGDGSQYQEMLRDAGESSKEFEQEAESAAQADRERMKLMEQGARLTEQLETATESYTRRMEDLDEMYHKGAIDLETLTRAMERQDDILVQSHGYAKDMTSATQETNDALGETGGVVQTASGDLGMFMNINRGAGRSVRNLGSTVAGLGVVLDVVNPGLGATAVHLGMVASAGGQAITSMYYLKTSMKNLVALAVNPYTLAIVGLVSGGMAIWKMYTKRQEEDNKRLEESTKKLEESVKSYGRTLELLGKIPKTTTTDEQVVENAKTAESAYKAAAIAEKEALNRRSKLAGEVEKERSAWLLSREEMLKVPEAAGVFAPLRTFEPSKGLKKQIADAVEASRAATTARIEAERLMDAARGRAPVAQARIDAAKAAEKEKEAAEQRKKTVSGMIADAEKERATIGMSAGQIAAYTARLLGASAATQAYIGRITDEANAQKTARQERESANKSLQQLMENLRWQAVALREGLTPNELAVRKLEQQMGVTLDAARAAAQHVRQLEEQKKAQEDAEKATDKMAKTQARMNDETDYAIAGSAKSIIYLQRQAEMLGGVANATARGTYMDRMGVTRSRGPVSVPLSKEREGAAVAANPSAQGGSAEGYLRDLLTIAKRHWTGDVVEVKQSGLN